MSNKWLPGQHDSWICRVIDHRLCVIGSRKSCLSPDARRISHRQSQTQRQTDSDTQSALRSLRYIRLPQSQAQDTNPTGDVYRRTVHSSIAEYMKASLPAAIQFTVPDQVVSAKQQSRQRRRAYIRGVLSSLSDFIAVPQSVHKDSCRP